MKHVLTIIILTLLTYHTTSTATYLTLNKSNSTINFWVTHLLFLTAKGSFTNFDGTIFWNTQQPNTSYFEGHIQVNSISTGIEKYDDLILTPPFFDEDQFQTITFKSTEITQLTPTTYSVTGNLTCKGKTFQLNETLTVTTVPTTNNQLESQFNATFKVNRQDYDIAKHITWPIVNDIVYINLHFITLPY
tara:strand:+ start:166 stop:735 length:570 start_codon:yes stop_codon:yes gene_type:complete